MIRFSNFHYNREPSYFFIFLSQMYYTLTFVTNVLYPYILPINTDVVHRYCLEQALSNLYNYLHTRH